MNGDEAIKIAITALRATANKWREVTPKSWWNRTESDKQRLSDAEIIDAVADALEVLRGRQ